MKTKRILSAILAFMFVLSTFTFNVGAGVFLTTSTVDVETIYIDPANGDDLNDGLTEALPVKTVPRAYTLMKVSGANDGGNLVFLSGLSVPYKGSDGITDQKYFGAAHTNLVTISGKTGTEVLSTSAQVGLMGPTKFENISLGSNGYNHWNSFNNNVTFGSGITKPASGYTYSAFLHVGGNGDILSDNAFTGTNLNAVINSGTFTGLYLGGAYLKSNQNTITGDAKVEINGGSTPVVVGNDTYSPGTSHADLIFEGNVLITINGGLVSSVTTAKVKEIKGSFQVIANNGRNSNVTLPTNAAMGAYFVKSAAGGTVTHTATPGVFNITPADNTKIIKAVNGTQTMYFTKGDIELPKGQTNITYVDGAAIPSVGIALTAPAANADAQTTATNSADYTSTVEWTPALTNGKFGSFVNYTAKVTVTPADNKALTSATTISGGLVPATTKLSYGKLIATFEFPRTAKPDGTYSVEYVPGANDATVTGVVPDPQFISSTSGGVITLIANPYTRIGYRFEGWNVISGSSSRTLQQGDLVDVRSDVVITPVWKQLLKYTVSFNGNGATGGTAPMRISQYTDSSIRLPKNSFQYVGHNFAGWTPDGGKTVYKELDYYKMGESNVVFSAIWVEGDAFVYLKAGSSGDGSSPENPVGSWKDAITSLSASGGIIYVIGSVVFQGTLTKNTNMITITGYDSTAKLTLAIYQSMVANGPLTIENICIDAGLYTHLNSQGYEFVIGENVTFKSNRIMVHGGTYSNNANAPSTSFKVLGSSMNQYFTTGAYITDSTKGVAGDANILVDDGGNIDLVSIGSDSYAANHVSGTHGGNINIVVNSGSIGKIAPGGKVPTINGAIQMIFNNGAKPTSVSTPDAVTNVYKIYAAVGGKVELTDTVGKYKIISDYDIRINDIVQAHTPDSIYTMPQPGTYNIVFGEPYDGTVDVTLAAPVGGESAYLWEPKVPADAKYNATMSKWISTSNVIDTYGVFDFETVYTGKVSVAPNPGYYFTSSVKYIINGEGVIPVSGSEGNMFLSDIFPETGVAPSNTVNFVSGDNEAVGETPAEDGAIWKYLETYTLPRNNYKRTNYIFVGWSDGFDVYRPGASYVMPNSDVTFTGKWFRRGSGNGGTPFVLILFNLQATTKDYGKNPDFPKNKKYPIISLGSAAFASLENAINGIKGLPDSTYDGEKVKVIKTDDNNDTKVCVNNWSLATTKAAVENYKYVSFTYYYETAKTTGGAIGKTPSIMAGYFQLPDGSNSTWQAKYIAGNKQIVANKWDTITFDIGAYAAANNIDPKAVLKQIHFYLLGTDTTTAAIKGDSVYLKDFVFSADLPVDHSADQKAEEKK